MINICEMNVTGWVDYFQYFQIVFQYLKAVYESKFMYLNCDEYGFVTLSGVNFKKLHFASI